MPRKRKGHKGKKRQTKKFKVETETELESLVEEHTRDVTEIVEKEEEEERRQKKLERKMELAEDQSEEEEEATDNANNAYNKLLQSFGGDLSDKIKKRKDRLKAEARMKFATLQAKAKAEEIKNGIGDEESKEDEDAESTSKEDDEQEAKEEEEDEEEDTYEKGLEEHQREDDTLISEAELALMGVEEEIVGDPFRICYPFDVSVSINSCYPIVAHCIAGRIDRRCGAQTHSAQR